MRKLLCSVGKLVVIGCDGRSKFNNFYDNDATIQLCNSLEICELVIDEEFNFFFSINVTACDAVASLIFDTFGISVFQFSGP